MKKAALLIGINYILDSQNRLNGCCNDVKNMANILCTKLGFNKKDVQVIADICPRLVPLTTKEHIFKSLYTLCIKSWRENLDYVYFHYSGHGSQEQDYSGDEIDGLDEGICPSDSATQGMILDDDLYAIFKDFNPRTKIIAVFDCCHSGSILDLPCEYNIESSKEHDNKINNKIDNIPKLVCLSGCLDKEVSLDTYDRVSRSYGGALTLSLIKALNDGGSTTLLDLHKRVNKYLKAGNFSQRPVLSSNFNLSSEDFL